MSSAQHHPHHRHVPVGDVLHAGAQDCGLHVNTSRCQINQDEPCVSGMDIKIRIYVDIDKDN